MKTAFMFSGQGSQYLGMCEDLYNNFDSVKNIFEKASLLLGYDVKTILFSEEEKLHNTLYTQPLMFVMYASILAILNEKGIHSDVTFGLSLGEYGAYLDSEVFTFEAGLKLIQKRAQYMNECTKTTQGIMSAVLGMDADKLQEVLNSVDGYVKIANYNTYGQLVISGSIKAVLQANKLAVENGAKRVIPLNTSGAFHTDIMFSAREKFTAFLYEMRKEIHEPKKPLLLNTTGDFYQENIQEQMALQITNSVLFYQQVERCIEEGVTTFIEIGPKKTLSSFVKKINRNLTILHVEDVKSLESTIQKMEV